MLELTLHVPIDRLTPHTLIPQPSMLGLCVDTEHQLIVKNKPFYLYFNTQYRFSQTTVSSDRVWFTAEDKKM